MGLSGDSRFMAAVALEQRAKKQAAQGADALDAWLGG